MSWSKTDTIKYYLMNFVKGGYDVLVPNFFYGWNECDLFRITQSDMVIEYEIKVSRSDFFVDFKKESRDCKKHDMIKSGAGRYCPNRFFYVTPQNLIKKEEVPKYAGLIYHDGGSWFGIIKNAPLLHKNKVGLETFREICRTLSQRNKTQRLKVSEIRNTDFDKEMSSMKREVERLQTEKRDLGNELFMLRHTKLPTHATS